MSWTPGDILITLDDDAVFDPVVTARIDTPDGPVWVMAEVLRSGPTLRLHGLHLHGTGPNSLGVTKLRWLIQVVMETIDVDEIIVGGATRTTGANRGRRSGQQRFQRKGHPSSP
ncbi:hypothetical protein [Brevundimonas goettingensis]|uniref:Uncharacterized protein n=1 Tax=Brevundimonas goettingensis TaxID=2774190 RepID=A0A975C6A8_9CAUL|nr:hypothetical protein [Brevundimonas goettingensis]QTC92775.1 hypothetical protein IFJ75_07960 [Brevundimonas goettingensis]